MVNSIGFRSWFERNKKTIEYVNLSFILIYVIISLYIIINFSDTLLYEIDGQGFEGKYTPTEKIEKLAENITKECEKYDNETWEGYVPLCQKSLVSGYIYYNINYTNKTRDKPSAEEVVERGYARCTGKAILFNALMESLGYKTHLVHQDNHLCSMVNFNGSWDFWNCNENEELKFLYERYV